MRFTMGFNHKLTFWKQKLLIYFRNLVIFFFTSSLIMVIVYRFVPVYITPLMLIRCVEYAWNGEDVRVLKKWTPIEEMPEYLIKSAIAAEDVHFVENNGFNWGAMYSAFDHNLHHKNIIGGSSIPQQTAKNVFLYPNRTYFRKALEAYFTVLIELIWNKKRIMEVYLNIAETGHGIYGMPMAAEVYYGKKPKELSKTEITTLVTLLPSPLTFNPKKQSERFHKKRQSIRNGADAIIKLDLEKRICERTYKTKKPKLDFMKILGF